MMKRKLFKMVIVTTLPVFVLMLSGCVSVSANDQWDFMFDNHYYRFGIEAITSKVYDKVETTAKERKAAKAREAAEAKALHWQQDGSSDFSGIQFYIPQDAETVEPLFIPRTVATALADLRRYKSGTWYREYEDKIVSIDMIVKGKNTNQWAVWYVTN